MIDDDAVPRAELSEWRREFGVVAGITRRGPGPAPGFDLGLWTGEPVGETMSRWRAFRKAMPDFAGLAFANQVHGDTVLRHRDVTGWTIHECADGHITSARGVLLVVTVADCIPVYIVDPATRTVALLHAGWKGTALGILPQTLTLLATQMGIAVENLVVHCGVGISGGCYEVGPDVFNGLSLPVPPGGKGQVDLRAILAAQARAAGVRRVSISYWCSSHDAEHFYSHRRSGGRDGRMVAYLGVVPVPGLDARD